MITTIIFDLSEVFLNGLLGTDKKLSKILNIPSEEILTAFKEAGLNDLFKGNICENDYWERILHKTNWKLNLEQLKSITRENFKEIKGTRKIIIELKKRNFKLGLLSVHAREWIDYCEKKFDFHRLFNSIVYSFDTQSCKPHKSAFQAILKKLDSRPENCLFIDDSKKNVLAANNLGMKTILFDNSAKLIESLKLFSINLDLLIS